MPATGWRGSIFPRPPPTRLVSLRKAMPGVRPTNLRPRPVKAPSPANLARPNRIAPHSQSAHERRRLQPGRPVVHRLLIPHQRKPPVVVQPLTAFLLARYALHLPEHSVRAVTVIAALPPAEFVQGELGPELSHNASGAVDQDGYPTKDSVAIDAGMESASRKR